MVRRQELGDLVDVLLIDGGVLLDQVEVVDRADVAHEHEALAVEIGVERARVGDPHRSPRERAHGRELLGLGHELEDVVGLRRRVPDVVHVGEDAGWSSDVGCDRHAGRPHFQALQVW